MPWSILRSKQENFAGILIEFGLNPLWLLSLFLFLLCGGSLNLQGILLVFFQVCVWLEVIGFTGFLVLNRLAVKRRCIAATPFECWDYDDLGKLMVAKMSSSRRAKLLVHLKQGMAQNERTPVHLLSMTRTKPQEPNSNKK
jgi:hypothetical protein